MDLFEGHLEGVAAEVTKRSDLLSSSCFQISFSHVICLAADTQLPLPAVSNDISVGVQKTGNRIWPQMKADGVLGSGFGKSDLLKIKRYFIRSDNAVWLFPAWAWAFFVFVVGVRSHSFVRPVYGEEGYKCLLNLKSWLLCIYLCWMVTVHTSPNICVIQASN